MKGRQQGFSLLELLVVLLVVGITLGTTIMNLGRLNNPLQNGSAQLVSFLKQVRARAVASTSAYRVIPISATQLTTQFGTTCANASTDDPALQLSLPSGTSLSAVDWEFCFTTKGRADSNLELTVREGGRVRRIEILLGGAVREL